MNEFIKKLIERLANIHRVVKTDEDLEWNRAVYSCAEIVNQLAEEYNNDFCEWQEKAAGGIELVREPHKLRLFHIEEERHFCPYCGKKIKVAPYQPKGK